MFKMIHPWQQMLINQDVSWYPNTDVFETGDGIIIRMELAGVSKEDIEIIFEDNELIIKGRRVDEYKSRMKRFYQMEIHFDDFERAIVLPEGVLPDSINARFERGMLEIFVDKSKERQGVHSVVIEVE